MISGTSVILKSIPSTNWSLDSSPYLSIPIGTVVDRLLQEWTTLSADQRRHIKNNSNMMSSSHSQLQKSGKDSENNESEGDWAEFSDYQSSPRDADKEGSDEQFNYGRRPQGDKSRPSRESTEIPEWLQMEDEMWQILKKMKEQYQETKTARTVRY